MMMKVMALRQVREEDSSRERMSRTHSPSRVRGVLQLMSSVLDSDSKSESETMGEVTKKSSTPRLGPQTFFKSPIRGDPSTTTLCRCDLRSNRPDQASNPISHARADRLATEHKEMNTHRHWRSADSKAGQAGVETRAPVLICGEQSRNIPRCSRRAQGGQMMHA